MKTKLLFLILLLFTALCILFFNIFYIEAKNIAIKKLHDEQTVYAKQAARGIEEYFSIWANTLASYAKMDEIMKFDETGKHYIKTLYEFNKDQARAITRVDEKGTIIYTYPVERSIGTNIAEKPHIKEVLRTLNPVISDVVRTAHGFDAVVLHMPIFIGVKFSGSIAVVLDFKRLAERYLDVIKIGKKGHPWMIGRDGMQLYSRMPGFAGVSALQNYKSSPTILSMIDKMMMEEEGRTTYMYGDSDTRQTKRYATYMPVKLYNTFWSIVVVSPEEEALSDLKLYRNKLAAVVFFIFVCGTVLATLGTKALFIVQEEEKRKKMEDQLRQSEELYRRLSHQFQGLLNAIPDQITVYDKDLRIIWSNMAAAESLDKKPEDMIGKTCSEVWPDTGPLCDKCPVLESFSTTDPSRPQNCMLEGKLWDVRAFPLADENSSITSVIEVLRDISDQHKLEEQLRQSQKLEGLGQLAGGIAHDFNNLLNAVIGYASLLQMRIPETDSKRHHVDQIIVAATRGASLTRQILALSRKQLLETKPVCINEIIRELEHMLRRLVREDITIKYSLNPGDITIKADAGQISQVLINLAINAADAMPQGGTLLISTELFDMDEHFIQVYGYEKTGRYVLLKVADTGVGIPEELKERLFDPFFTTKEVGKGTGLGLSVVHGIVKQHKGYINVYSEKDKGTIFKIYLPLSESGKHIAEEAPKEEVVGGTEAILIAEDDEALRHLTSTILKQYGYRVIEAVDGQDAIEQFIKNREDIALVVLDGVMPKKSGKQAYEEMQKLSPDIKAVFVSGYSEDIFAKDWMPGPSVKFIAKPVSPEDLLRAIRGLLDSSESEKNQEDSPL
ncbi:MAG: ATP-binding protein [Dissulfurispiraceae bacterium]|jgi:signal transduction histidine kinase/ActR/RegA family two-component response regulator|nr:ATP-binding protein [Dissulfurispiraceae bacterium]